MSAGELRVLHVIPGEEGGTSMIFAKREVRSLERLGLASATFFLASRTSPRALLAERRRFRALVAAFRPALVHAHFGTVTALFCGLSSRVPVVVTYRGSDLNFEPDRALRSAGKVVLSQLAALLARRIVCVSEGLRARLWWRKGIAQVIPSGLDVDAFVPLSKTQARRQLGWEDAEKVVLFNAGGGRKVKRRELAEAAVELARQGCGPIRLAVLGGSVDGSQVPVWMNAADCLLLTSASEGSPTVVKEAMACNLPVVTVDVGDVRDLLRDVAPSRIVGDDPRRLAAALAEVLAEGRRSNGRDAALPLALESVAERILQVYRGVAPRRPS